MKDRRQRNTESEGKTQGVRGRENRKGEEKTNREVWLGDKDEELQADRKYMCRAMQCIFR